MLREQVISFLEAALVLLTVTNAFSVAAAAYAISLARGLIRTESRPTTEEAAILSRWLRMRA